MERYLNIIHFCFYKGHYKLHLLANKINPFHLIHKLPFQKKRYEKLGIDIYKEIDRSFSETKFGLSVMTAGGLLWGFLSIFFFALLILFNLIVYGTMLHVLIISAMSGMACYVFVFKNDKYINYFNEFEKSSKRQKWKYVWVTSVSIMALFLLLYVGVVT